MTLAEHEIEAMRELGRRFAYDREAIVLEVLGVKAPPLPPLPKYTKENPRVWIIDPPSPECPFCNGLIKEARFWIDEISAVHQFVHADADNACGRDDARRREREAHGR